MNDKLKDARDILIDTLTEAALGPAAPAAQSSAVARRLDEALQEYERALMSAYGVAIPQPGPEKNDA